MLILNQLLNKLIINSKNFETLLLQLQHRSIFIEIKKSILKNIYIQLDINSINLSINEKHKAADLYISGTLPDLLNILFDKPTSLANTNLDITGDLEILNNFYILITNIDIDWEELISSISSPEISAFLGKNMHWIYGRIKNHKNTLKQEILDYLQYETDELISNEELEQFYNELEELRDDIERLAAKINTYANL